MKPLNSMTALAKLAIVFGVLLLAFVVIGGIFVVSNRQRINNRIEAIRAEGDPASIDDFFQSPIDPAENGATHLVGVIDRMSDLYNSVWNDLGADGFDWNQGVTAETLARLTKEFEQDAFLAVAHQKAARSNRFRWRDQQYDTPSKFNEAMLDDYGHLLTAARYNSVYVRYLVLQGEHELAARSCLDQLRLCRLQDEVPTLTGFLVNTACRNSALADLNQLVRSMKLSESTHAAIETELAQHDSMDRFVHALKTERAFGIDSFRSMPRFLTSQIDNYLDMMNEQIEIANRPHHLTSGMNFTPATGLSITIQPAIQSARDAMNRTLATVRCLRVFNAIVGKSKSDNSTTVTLDSLGLPTDAITDPFTGNELKTKPTERGWIIYSLGPNAVDDQGSVADESDIGVAPQQPAD